MWRAEYLTLYSPVIDDCAEVKWLPFHVTQCLSGFNHKTLQPSYSHINWALVQPSSNANSLNHCAPASISVSKSKLHPCRKNRHGTSWVSFELVFDIFHCVTHHRSINIAIHCPGKHFRIFQSSYSRIQHSNWARQAPGLYGYKNFVIKTGQTLCYMEGSPLTSAQSSITGLYSVRYSPLHIINSCYYKFHISKDQQENMKFTIICHLVAFFVCDYLLIKGSQMTNNCKFHVLLL